MHADKLLGAEVSDSDGITEERRGTFRCSTVRSPQLKVFGNPEAEVESVAKWYKTAGRRCLKRTS